MEIVQVATLETVFVEMPGGIEVIEIAVQGPPGPPGPVGPQGSDGAFDGAIADVTPDPSLLFENALI